MAGVGVNVGVVWGCKWGGCGVEGVGVEGGGGVARLATQLEQHCEMMFVGRGILGNCFSRSNLVS